MARIRTIKPEFWDSPATARASLRARLFFIAMWNWADDYGVGSANHRQLLGFAFPNDDDVSVKDLPSLCKEVADCYGIVFFEYKQRPYFVIPSWNEHQRTERRARRDEALHETAEQAILAHKHAEVEPVAEMRGYSDAKQGSSGAGTGEREQGKGNRGTGEQGNKGTSEIEISRPDVDYLLDCLDSEIATNGAKKPSRSKANIDAARLLIDKDGYSVEQVEAIIRWSQNNEFWRTNILSMSKLREKFDQLKLQAQRASTDRKKSKSDDAHSFIERLENIDGTSRGRQATNDHLQLR